MQLEKEKRKNIHIVKGTFVRLLFLLHSSVILWRVTEVRGNELLWIYCISFSFILFEGLWILVTRHGIEYKW